MQSFRDITLSNGVIIGVFQGSRGANPTLDILVKYHEPGKAVRTPQHIHWAIDLLIKKSRDKVLTVRFVEFLLSMWSQVQPFTTQAEQQACALRHASSPALQTFVPLNAYGEYSVEFIAHILELIMIQEKTGCATAHMFQGVLQAIRDDKDIFQIVSAASYRG